MKRIKVGIVVRPDLWRDLKVESAQQGIPVPDMLDRFITDGLEKVKRERASTHHTKGEKR